MHEYSLVQALLERVATLARESGATAVHGLNVRIGDLAGVERELFRTAYETCRGGTLCAKADLNIEPVPVSWVCGPCGIALAEGGVLTCPRCGAPAHLAAGDEMVLDRIEMEVP